MERDVKRMNNIEANGPEKSASSHKTGYFRKVGVVVAASLLIAIGAGGAAVMTAGQPHAYALTDNGYTDKKVIAVSGKGELMVAPDVAYLDVGVETRAATAKEAQANNAAKFAGVEKMLLTTYAIPAKEVKTTGFNVQPEYNYTEKEGNKLTGYLAVHSIRVTYRKLDAIGTLLDALSAAGANRVGGVQFDTEKKEQYELQALEKAMASSDAKAAVLAKASKRQLKGVLSVNEGGISVVPVYGEYNQAKAETASDGAAPTSIQSGEITIHTDITVIYEME
jgi:uncharacterized protein YggE